jgi:hypothetical protein
MKSQADEMPTAPRDNCEDSEADLELSSYADFWDFYVREHSRPLTRLLHLIGTTLGLGLFVYFVATGRWYFFPVFFVVGYAFAWFSHFVVEKNRPATFKYPFWSFISDFRMIAYMLTGRMKREVERVLRSN